VGLLQDLVAALTGSDTKGKPKFSAAVLRQNAEPIRNKVNARGEPTQQILSDMDGKLLREPWKRPAGYAPQGAPGYDDLRVRRQPYRTPQPNLGISMHQLQGRDNPGYTPLQSPPGMRYAAGLQGAPMPPVNRINPQLRDDGYFYDQ
jgi:hypothetical protein